VRKAKYVFFLPNLFAAAAVGRVVGSLTTSRRHFPTSDATTNDAGELCRATEGSEILKYTPLNETSFPSEEMVHKL